MSIKKTYCEAEAAPAEQDCDSVQLQRCEDEAWLLTDFFKIDKLVKKDMAGKENVAKQQISSFVTMYKQQM